jgi:hypothetical protein
MARSRPRAARGSLLLALAVQLLPLTSALSCDRSEAPPAPRSASGSTLARGYGVTIQGVAYVPGDRVQSFGLIASCEALDGKTCADRAWDGGEVDAVTRAALFAGKLSGFDTSYDSKQPEVRIHARQDTAPAPACLDGKSTCWFGSTNCVESAEVLLDAQGAPVIESHPKSSWSFTRCLRWALEVSTVNVYAWADFLGIDRLHVLRSVVLHEMGHSLGLEHHREGLMRGNLPVCYFIEPGDPRDRFDPAAKSDAFQRFECLEGVKEPQLAPIQRAKLDAYRPAGPGWSLISP